METSIIIRTKNEEKWIGAVLEKLYQQTYRDFEIIIVDSGSTDRTLEIISEYPIRLIRIKSENFSYPYALNLGCENARAEKFLVILSAHSIPVSDYWLEKGIADFGRNEKIAGVYGPQKALPGSTIWDKFFYSFFYYTGKAFFLGMKRRIVEKSDMGVLGFTNAAIRKDLWEKRKFNENFGFGGEDGEWADYWIKQGYLILKDYDFTVFHSHNLGLIGWMGQWQHWISCSKPQRFSREKLSKFRTN